MGLKIDHTQDTISLNNGGRAIKFDLTGAIKIPVGNDTASNKPETPEAGMIRWNTENAGGSGVAGVEVYDGSIWTQVAGGGGGGGGATDRIQDTAGTTYVDTDQTANQVTIGANSVIVAEFSDEQISLGSTAMAGPAKIIPDDDTPLVVSAGDSSVLDVDGETLYLFGGLGNGTGNVGQVKLHVDYIPEDPESVAPKSYVDQKTPIELVTFKSGVPTASEIIYKRVFARNADFLATLAGSQAHADTAATASTTFNILKNGETIGTIVFAAAGNTGTLSLTADASFAVGDRLTIVAPATPDSTLADIAITIVGL